MIGRQIRFLILLMLLTASISSAQQITIVQQGKPTNIRGLSVVNNKIAWVSGSKGYVAHTADGGKTWAWEQVKGCETADFRSIKAFSDKEAIIMSSGTPALILKTIDGGQTWQLKYRNPDTAYFLDAMSFANTKHGFVLGDPIGNKFLILETTDGSETWNTHQNNPVAIPKEAAFAASSTCLHVASNNTIFIASGGSAAKVDIQRSNNEWRNVQVPIVKGEASKGAFSIAVNGNNFVVVGGDYQHDKNSDSTACYSIDGGKTWQLVSKQPNGFQSCVTYLENNILLSTGTPGSNLSIDGGKTWNKIDDTSFNVCGKAKQKNLTILAGNEGKIAIYQP